MNNKLNYKIGIISLGLLLALSLPGGNVADGFNSEAFAAGTGTEAPGFVLHSLSGDKVSLQSFKGKPVLLNFWATWCPYCRKERAHLNKLYKEYEDKGLVILSVSTDRSIKKLKKYMDDTPAEFIVLSDREGRVSSSYNIMGLPSSLLINREGIIKYRFTGFREWTSKDSKRVIDSLF